MPPSEKIKHLIGRSVWTAALIVTAFGLAGCAPAASIVSDLINPVRHDDAAPEPDTDTHDNLFVVDLHADSLLWNRDLLDQSDWGHVDLPRLIEGNVALQVFSVSTHTPFEKKLDDNQTCAEGDGINSAALLHWFQFGPGVGAQTTRERAMEQAKRLAAYAQRSKIMHGFDESQPELRLILTVEDLQQLVVDRANDENVVGAMLALEGAHWVSGDNETVHTDVDELFDHGFRMVAATHRFTNDLAGSSEDCNDRGSLTAAGTEFLSYAQNIGMIVDLAHLSTAGVEDALQDLSEPIVISHTGMYASCKMNEECDCLEERNLTDSLAKKVVADGGLIGIGFFERAVGEGFSCVSKAFQAAHDAIDSEATPAHLNLAYGSDFDGAAKLPIDISQMNQITATWLNLQDEQQRPLISETEIYDIAGLNACRLFARRLPSEISNVPRDARDIDSICAWPIPAQISQP